MVDAISLRVDHVIVRVHCCCDDSHSLFVLLLRKGDTREGGCGREQAFRWLIAPWCKRQDMA